MNYGEELPDFSVRLLKDKEKRGVLVESRNFNRLIQAEKLHRVAELIQVGSIVDSISDEPFLIFLILKAISINGIAFRGLHRHFLNLLHDKVFPSAVPEDKKAVLTLLQGLLPIEFLVLVENLRCL